MPLVELFYTKWFITMECSPFHFSVTKNSSRIIPTVVYTDTVSIGLSGSIAFAHWAGAIVCICLSMFVYLFLVPISHYTFDTHCHIYATLSLYTSVL